MGDSRKTVLITGCSGTGIGHHLALSFQAAGLRVFATARKTSSITDLADKGIETFALTVDDQSSVRALFQDIDSLVGSKGTGRGLDYLVNNAGKNYTIPGTDIDLNEAKAMFNTNLFAVMDINTVFLPLMVKSKGTIVHIGSIAGVFPYVFGSAYNASKAALHQYCSTLRVELSLLDVHVVIVKTGGVRSQIARDERSLPPGSYFHGIQTIYDRRQKHSQEVGMDTRTYADTVVTQVLNSRGNLWNTSEIWAGAKANTVYWAEWVDRLWPGGIFDWYMRQMFGLKAGMLEQKKSN